MTVRRRKAVFNTEQDARILAVYKAGINKGQVTALAKELGIHIRSVSRRAQELIAMDESAKRFRPGASTRSKLGESEIIRRRMSSFLLEGGCG